MKINSPRNTRLAGRLVFASAILAASLITTLTSQGLAVGSADGVTVSGEARGHTPTCFTFTLTESAVAEINAHSTSIDTYLILYRDKGEKEEGGRLEVVAENDDWQGTDSRLSLDLEAGNYVAGVRSYSRTQSGPFELSLSFHAVGDLTELVKRNGVVAADSAVFPAPMMESFRLDIPVGDLGEIVGVSSPEPFQATMVPSGEEPSFTGEEATFHELTVASGAVVSLAFDVDLETEVTVYSLGSSTDLAELATPYVHFSRVSGAGHHIDAAAGIVTIELASDEFDTYLTVINEEGVVLASNDDFEGTNSRVEFMLGQPTRLFAVVTSFGGMGTGDYTLGWGVMNYETVEEKLTLIPGIRHYKHVEFSEPIELMVSLESDDFDTFLVLRDGVTGDVIEENDDFGDGTNSRLVAAVQGGKYIIEARSYGESEGGAAVLRVGSREGSDVTTARGVLAEGDRLEVSGSSMTGHRHEFELEAGRSYTFNLTSGEFDAYLYLLDAAGLILESDDDGGNGTNSKIVYTPSENETVVVVATSFSRDSVGAYSLSMGAGADSSITDTVDGTLEVANAVTVPVAKGLLLELAPEAGERLVVANQGALLFDLSQTDLQSAASLTVAPGSSTRIFATSLSDVSDAFGTEALNLNRWIPGMDFQAATGGRVYTVGKSMTVALADSSGTVTAVPIPDEGVQRRGEGFEFNIESNSRVTVDVRGRDNFDAYLTVYSEMGEVIASNDDFGGDVSHSRVVLEDFSGRATAWVGASFAEHTGAFDITVSSSSLSSLQGVSVVRAAHLDEVAASSRSGNGIDGSTGPLLWESLEWMDDVDAALARGVAENKPVYIHFTTDWCGWCRVMERETYSEESIFAEMRDRLILVKIDGDTQGDIARRYGVRGYPTVLLMAGNGTELARGSGHHAPERFRSEILSKIP